MNEPKIALIIVNYNQQHYLDTCLDSIFNQTYKNIEVYFIDNNSPDTSYLKFLKKKYTFKEVIANKENLGYPTAANQGMRLAKDADYIVVTNPDIIYSPSYIEKIVHRIKKDPRIAAATGKIYKYDFKEKATTKYIDTTGLYIDKSLRVTDGGQGLVDKGQFDREREVFGVSGACPIYKKEALEAINLQNEYFDEDFFMYKDDVDLSWRFQLAGYKSLYFPKSVAFHGRGTGVIERRTTRQIFKNRRKLSRFQRYYSFRNQHLMCLKNVPWGTYLRYLPHILFRDITTFIYTLLYEPFQFKAIYEYIKMAPLFIKKRMRIMKHRKASSSEINRWMNEKPPTARTAPTARKK